MIKQGYGGTLYAVVDRHFAWQLRILNTTKDDVDGFKYRVFAVHQLDGERHRSRVTIAVQGGDDRRIHVYQLVGRLWLDMTWPTHHGAAEL